MDNKEIIEFNDLLRKRVEGKGDASFIDKEIAQRFEKEYTVMVSDLSSFSKLTHEVGIIHSLGLIAKAHEIAEPILRTLGGEVLRADPESLVVLFRRPMDAVMAARAVNRAFEEHNSGVSEDHKLSICLGIGHGKMLRAGGCVYGDQVNQAYRLGEDVFGKCEVRLTPEAYEKVAHLESLQFRESGSVQIGGLTLKAYELIFT